MSLKIKRNKCKLTLSGKHFWEMINFQWEIIPHGMRPKNYYRKCRACKVVDDKIRLYKNKG